MDNGCKRKTCNKRHREICRNGPKCTYQIKNSCEFKHESVLVKDHLEKVKEEASKVKSESEALKHQIKEPKKTIQNQKNKLENINSEESKMHQLVSDIKNLKSKHKDEKVQFEDMLAKSKKEIYIKDEQIKDLQKIIKNNTVPSQNIPT